MPRIEPRSWIVTSTMAENSHINAKRIYTKEIANFLIVIFNFNFNFLIVIFNIIVNFNAKEIYAKEIANLLIVIFNIIYTFNFNFIVIIVNFNFNFNFIVIVGEPDYPQTLYHEDAHHFQLDPWVFCTGHRVIQRG